VIVNYDEAVEVGIVWWESIVIHEIIAVIVDEADEKLSDVMI
jgi:hypothetical protein